MTLQTFTCLTCQRKTKGAGPHARHVATHGRHGPLPARKAADSTFATKLRAFVRAEVAAQLRRVVGL